MNYKVTYLTSSDKYAAKHLSRTVNEKNLANTISGLIARGYIVTSVKAA